MEKPELLNRLILDFLDKEPAATMLPIRRLSPNAAAHRPCVAEAIEGMAPRGPCDRGREFYAFR